MAMKAFCTGSCGDKGRVGMGYCMYQELVAVGSLLMMGSVVSESSGGLFVFAATFEGWGGIDHLRPHDLVLKKRSGIRAVVTKINKRESPVDGKP